MRKLMTLSFIIAAGVLAGWCSTQSLRPASKPRPITTRGALPAVEQSLIDRFKEAKPSVVYITTLALRQDWFSLDVQTVQTGTGSGFIWDEQGHIVTNYHVIEGVVEAGQEMEATMSDGSKHRAQAIGIAPEKDLAVIRLLDSPQKLRPIPVGSSQDLQVGQSVMAIGNPFGLDLTLTTGIVSALGREIQSTPRRRISDVIQTDAAINPGNSGGPLLDSAGRLIGVNTAIQSPSGASAGIGFAVPVDTVNRIVPQLISKGRIQRANIGIEALEGPGVQYFDNPEGAIILRVQRLGPADRAGLRGIGQQGRRYVLGDVITGVNGKKIKDVNGLMDALEANPEAESLELEILREGNKRKVRVNLQGKLSI